MVCEKIEKYQDSYHKYYLNKLNNELFDLMQEIYKIEEIQRLTRKEKEIIEACKDVKQYERNYNSYDNTDDNNEIKSLYEDNLYVFLYYSEKLEDFYNKDRLNNIESKLLYKYLKKYQRKDMNSYFYKYHNEKIELYI